MVVSEPLHAFCSPGLRGSFVDHPSVRFWPPARRDDLKGLMDANAPGHVLIVDGVFAGPLAVSGTECRIMMDAGWRLYGCSSLGALRAAELYTLGMIGLGRIFDLLRIGLVIDDSELAAAYHPRTWREMTIPLINLRCRLLDGVDLPAEVKVAIWTAAKSLFYMDRTPNEILTVLEKVDIVEDSTTAFVHSLVDGPTQKLMDATHALNLLTGGIRIDATSHYDC